MQVRFKPPVALRSVCLAVLAITLSAAALSPARAQSPERPLQMVVPFAAGGAIDFVARSFAQALDRQLQQRIVVVNRDGASGTIAFNAALAAPADGYTILFGAVTPLTVHLHWMKGLQFDATSFVPVCQTFENNFFVATAPGSPLKSLESALTNARARPGQLSYAHTGVASSPHLAGAELFQKAGVQLVDVPFRSEASMLVPLKDGSIDLGIVTSNAVMTQGLTPLAVFAERRMAAFPAVPTIKELGYAVTPSGYGGLMMRATTPAAIVAKIESACREAVADPDYKQAAERNHQDAEYLGRAGFTARMEADRRSKATLLKSVKFER
jgi:tripartite-type tricarboxylate transporter receptor subunit TctC